MRVGRTTIVYFGSQMGKSVAGFIATLAIARFLGPKSLGIYSVAIALIFWFTVPSAAIQNSVIKRVSEGTDRNQYLGGGFLLNAILGLLVATSIISFAGPVDQFIGAQVSGLVAALLLGNILFKTVTGGLSGQKKVAATGLIQALEQVIRTGLQVGLILIGYQVTGLVFGHTLSFLLAAMIGMFFYDFWPSRPSYYHLHNIIVYAKYSWLGSLKTRSFAWMDTVVLAFFVGSALIGIYEVAWSLASVLGVMSISIKRTLFPEISELGANEDLDRIRHFLNEGLAFTGIFGIPGLFGALIMGPRILKIYRPEFKTGASVLLILILARLAAAYSGQLLSTINGVDRPDVAFRINLIFIFTNLILNILLIAELGWLGAAIATTLASMVSLILGYISVVKLIGVFEVPSREIGYQAVSGMAMALILSGFDGLLPNSHLFTIGLVLFGAGLYVIILGILSNRFRNKIIVLLPDTRKLV